MARMIDKEMPFEKKRFQTAFKIGKTRACLGHAPYKQATLAKGGILLADQMMS